LTIPPPLRGLAPGFYRVGNAVTKSTARVGSIILAADSHFRCTVM